MTDIQDPGKLEVKGTGSVPGPSVLSWQKAFLALAPSMWPNVSGICAKVGISRPLFYKSLPRYPKFAAQIQDIDQAITDAVEGLTANLAMIPKHVIDRMAYLRARRPELYDRAKRVVVEGYRMTGAQAAQRLGAVETAVDAEIVKSYTNRKERKAIKAGRLLVEGEGQTGGGKA